MSTPTILQKTDFSKASSILSNILPKVLQSPGMKDICFGTMFTLLGAHFIRKSGMPLPQRVLPYLPSRLQPSPSVSQRPAHTSKLCSCCEKKMEKMPLHRKTAAVGLAALATGTLLAVKGALTFYHKKSYSA